MNIDEVVLRHPDPADAAAVAEVWLASRRAALPTVRGAHSDEDVRAWIRDVVVAAPDSWIAEVRATVVGMMALGEGWIDQLYLDPAWRGRGIGDRLVTLAKQRYPAGLHLWTFQVNGPACRFYERHGFLAVERTDGADNEEREPDVRYRWLPGGPAPTSMPR